MQDSDWDDDFNLSDTERVNEKNNIFLEALLLGIFENFGVVGGENKIVF